MSQTPVLLKPQFLNEVVPRAGAGQLLTETIPEHEPKKCFPECDTGTDCTYPSCKSPGNSR